MRRPPDRPIAAKRPKTPLSRPSSPRSRVRIEIGRSGGEARRRRHPSSDAFGINSSPPAFSAPEFSTDPPASPNIAAWTCSPPPASNCPAPARPARGLRARARCARRCSPTRFWRKRGRKPRSRRPRRSAMRHRLCAPRQAGVRQTVRSRGPADLHLVHPRKAARYKTADPDSVYTLAFERPIRRGAVDVALGRFEDGSGMNEIVAPFELKGPTTRDLDAPMPGRGRSRCSRPGTTRWTRRARNGCCCRIAWKSGSTVSGAGATPTKSST